MAFDFSQAERIRQERAAQLLAEEEARNAELEGTHEHQGGGLRAYSLSPAIGANYDFLPERRLFDAILAALDSAGLEPLAPPRIETREANITYTLHAKSGQDLLEFMISSLSQRVLVRSSRNRGGLLDSKLKRGGKMPSVTGESYIVGLNLEAYVLQEESGALHLHNQDQLLKNLNEFILNKYGLNADRLHRDTQENSSSSSSSLWVASRVVTWWGSLTPSQRVIAPVVVGMAAVGTLAFARIAARKNA